MQEMLRFGSQKTVNLGIQAKRQNLQPLLTKASRETKSVTAHSKSIDKVLNENHQVFKEIEMTIKAKPEEAAKVESQIDIKLVQCSHQLCLL